MDEELFEIKTCKSVDEGTLDLFEYRDYHKKIIYEYVGRTAVNNGIKGYTKQLAFLPNDSGLISISQIGTIVAQLRKDKWYCSQNMFKLIPKNSRLFSSFVLSSINRMIKGKYGSGYSNYPTLENLKNDKIQLPTKNGEIDFEFMESFVAELEVQRVAELEAQRVAELEAYLTVTGLKDCELTEEEEQVIENFEQINWQEKNIIDVFYVKNTRNILSNAVIPNSGRTPYLCASAENNGVYSYISYDETCIDKGNCIFIGGKTFVVTYQESDFYSNDSHNLALYLKNNDTRTKGNQLYIITCIIKSLKNNYSWGNSISNKKIRNDRIMLPVTYGEVDFCNMETLISAVQKLVIKDVILFSGKKIEATKKLIGKTNI